MANDEGFLASKVKERNQFTGTDWLGNPVDGNNNRKYFSGTSIENPNYHE